MAVDEQSYKYHLPIFVINDPKIYKQKSKKIIEASSDKDLEVTLRFFHIDKKFTINTQDKISSLILQAEQMVEGEQDFDPENEKIKLLFRGQMMETNDLVGNYLKKNEIVQVFKVNK